MSPDLDRGTLCKKRTMKKEIKNIVFDMGRVLLDFSPEKVLKPYFTDEADCAYMKQVIFDSGEWDRLDAGEFSEAEALEMWLAETPDHLKEALRTMFAEWHNYLTPIDGMAELVAELKKNGYRCYLCSNTAARFEVYWQEREALRLLDGRFVSAFHKLMKPDAAMYRKMFETFSLIPEECFFVDDRIINIEGAAKLGMRGFLFETYDVDALKEAMRREGIRI